MKGYLIAFEGIDGGGKSTQTKRLAGSLQARGCDVVLTREPTDSVYGKQIRQQRKQRLPAHEELKLFLQDRFEHVTQVINPALASGSVVITDRYYMSTAAYQCTKDLTVNEILAFNESFAPIPNRVILVDIDPVVSLKRISSYRSSDVFESEVYLQECRRHFLDIAASRSHVHVFNGLQHVDTLAESILTDALQMLDMS